MMMMISGCDELHDVCSSFHPGRPHRMDHSLWCYHSLFSYPIPARPHFHHHHVPSLRPCPTFHPRAMDL